MNEPKIEAPAPERIRAAVFIVLGAATGLASLAWAKARAGAFEISAVTAALFLAPSLYFLWSRSPAARLAWLFLCGCALAGTGYLLEHPHALDSNSISLGLICVAAFTVLALVTPQAPAPAGRVGAFVTLLSAVVTIVIYRVFTVLAADIPNEQRSLMIGGYEVHHLNVGLAGALVLSALAPPANAALRITYFILLGSALGGWIDQIGYYFFAVLGDREYGEPASIGGAAIGLMLLAASALAIKTKLTPR